MKTKKLSKKLYLNKRTVATLNDDEMKKLRGGGGATEEETTPKCTCPTSAPINPTKDPIIDTV
jgi:natural product precursor